MGAFFAKEITEAAIQIEKNGQIFYQRMAEQASSEAVRGVFLDLAQQEERHIAELQLLLGRLPDPPDTWEREEFTMYLVDLANAHVFREDGSGERMAQQVESDVAAIDLGIQFEKDTVLFLYEFHGLVRPEEKTVVDRLIVWEKEHLVRLVRMKWDLTGQARQR
jgi:rubrerythrin